MKHLRYLLYLLGHKWFVFIECCRLGIPWREITHDLSKFSVLEWDPTPIGFSAMPGTEKFSRKLGFTTGLPTIIIGNTECYGQVKYVK